MTNTEKEYVDVRLQFAQEILRQATRDQKHGYQNLTSTTPNDVRKLAQWYIDFHLARAADEISITKLLEDRDKAAEAARTAIRANDIQELRIEKFREDVAELARRLEVSERGRVANGQQGWSCPVCGQVWAPWVTTCSRHVPVMASDAGE